MLKKDIITLCILHLLMEKERYGYEMIALLKSSFPDTQESVLYALLRSLYKDGNASTYLQESAEGPVRKYYRLSEQGVQYYHALYDQWKQLQQSLQNLGIS